MGFSVKTYTFSCRILEGCGMTYKTQKTKWGAALLSVALGNDL